MDSVVPSRLDAVRLTESLLIGTVRCLVLAGGAVDGRGIDPSWPGRSLEACGVCDLGVVFLTT